MELPIVETVELSKDEKLKMLNQKLNAMLHSKNINLSEAT